MDTYDDLLAALRAEVTEVEERDERERAQQFLAALDPESSEGMWFDAVAETFPSRLAAAIAYVRDVKR